MCDENEQNNETDETATSSEINTHSQVHTNTFHKVSMTGFFKGKGLWGLRNILQNCVVNRPEIRGFWMWRREIF